MNRQPDYRADYYSLGVTLFQLAAGQLPFHAADPLGWAHAHLSKQAPLLSELRPAIPRVFAELVAKLMAKNPDERYQSSRGLIADLETCANAWSTDRRIPQFSLGSRDISPRFEVSRELVGRDAEPGFASCVRPSPRVAHSPAAPVWCTRDGQVLDSRQARPLRFRRRGILPHQHVRSTARKCAVFSAGALAAKSDCTTAHESDTRLLEWNQRLIAGLGSNVAVMCDLAPALAQIVGAHPAAIELSPSETQHRLEHVLREFVKVFARKEHPLVIAIDDSQ